MIKYILKCNKNHEFKKTFRVTWVGRIEDFKTKSLEKVIGDLENINQSLGTHIIFNLIGQGKDLNQIKNKTSLSSLDYRFFDYLEISQLKKFLKEASKKNVAIIAIQKLRYNVIKIQRTWCTYRLITKHRLIAIQKKWLLIEKRNKLFLLDKI